MGRRINGIGLDFTNPELYQFIKNEATKGKDGHAIVLAINQQFGSILTDDDFHQMSNSQYSGWTEKDNRIYGLKIRHAISDGKCLARNAIRSAMLKAAIGGRKVKSTTTRTRKLRIGGVLTDDEEIETVTNETELAPNLSAMLHLLNHIDPEWRKQNQNRAPEDLEEDFTPDGVPQDIEHGIDIHKWIDEQVL